MGDVGEVVCRAGRRRNGWIAVGIGTAGAALCAVCAAIAAGVEWWLGLALALAAMTLVSLNLLVARVRADAYGLHTRTMLRRRSVPWRDVVDIRVHSRRARGGDVHRVELVLRNRRTLLLPLPSSWGARDPGFDEKMAALRALHSRYGSPESDHVHVVSYRTAGRGLALLLSMCALFLAGAGLAAWFVPVTASHAQAWRAVAPCTAKTPAAERDECLSTVPAVIARTDPHQPRKRSWLYFTDGRPLQRLAVSQGAALAFEPGDAVELTVWRGEVMQVDGDHYVWHEYVSGAGDVAAVAAGLLLAAGVPGAQVLLRLRGRRLPDDEVLPSVLPFAVVLVVSGAWLLPLCYQHPTSPPSSPGALAWAGAGSVVTLGLFAWAWHATRIRRPEAIGATGDEHRKVFLAARFLDETDYNPYGNFGTHIALGGGQPPEVLPHGGPGRFAAKRIPVERLTVGATRRARGSDGENLPRSWHIAELDDAGTPVRLAAAPADLARILHALRLAESSAVATPEP